jgi:hypothetical protein
MYEEDTIYKDSAVITRIIWKWWRSARHQCLMPPIPAMQEVNFGRIVVQSQER